MLIHDVNKKIVDLRFSKYDESELEELRGKIQKLEAKIPTAKTKKADYEAEIEKLTSELKTLEDEYEDERRAGRARFKEKVYIDYKGKNRRPPYHFTWVRYTPTNDYREFNQWITGYDYTPVKLGKDPFYPTGAKVNAANLWQFGDLVFVKRDLKAYLLDKVAEQKRQIGGQSLIDRLNQQFENEDKYMVENKLNSLQAMQRQIEENGHEVDDSILRNLGI